MFIAIKLQHFLRRNLGFRNARQNRDIRLSYFQSTSQFYCIPRRLASTSAISREVTSGKSDSIPFTPERMSSSSASRGASPAVVQTGLPSRWTFPTISGSARIHSGHSRTISIQAVTKSSMSSVLRMKPRVRILGLSWRNCIRSSRVLTPTMTSNTAS